METRQSSAIFGLGNKITCDDGKITGCRLPTNLQVLRCLIYHIDEGAQKNRTKWESAKMVLSQVTQFYEKANIPMITERKACEKVLKLLENNAKLRAIPLNRRSVPKTIDKVKQMEDNLALTFSLWSENVEDQMKNKEDLAFLQSMKSDRLATFGSFDKALDEKSKRREQRLKLQEVRKAKIEDEISSKLYSSGIPNSTDDSDEQSETDDTQNNIFEGPSTCTRCHHRTARTGMNAFIPHDILKRPNLVSVATRLNMTPGQQATYTEAIIAELGAQTSKVAVSYSTADRSRREVAKKISTAYREQWCFPKLATLHWDSKLSSLLSNKYKSEERLTIVVGNVHEQKVLGVPRYPKGTDQKCGSIIADLIYEQLTSWQCVQSIVNMAFDTTASNTGHTTAACVSMQKKLGHALLWSACRHHVGEVILNHVFDDLRVEASRSPDITLFKRFHENFDNLDYANGELEPLNFKSVSGQAKNIVNDHRAIAIQTAKSFINTGNNRDDYLEFAKLCIIFLDYTNITQPAQFNRPGALHKARWMAKLLHSIKICLLQKQIEKLPVGTVTSKQQVSKIRDFVNFVTLIYSSWWMTCNSAVNAPWNDLQLFRSFTTYKTVHPVISQSAIRAFENHFWYLTQEMVPLALWSIKVPTEERKAIADAMLNAKPNSVEAVFEFQHRHGMGFGKPNFPKNLTLETTLSDLVGTDSWFLFHVLELDTDFLTEDVGKWPSCESYKKSLTKIQALNVVNDCAERGIKLGTDYLESAKCEEHYQNVLQVVEQDRKKQPNLRKRAKLTED